MKNLVGTSSIFLLFLPLLFNACDGGGGGGGSNVAPTVSITSPADGAQFSQGDSVVFRCTATDAEDGTLTGTSLVWTSSLDGHIGTSGSCTRNDLSVGTHTITLTATDSGGASASDSITLRVTANQPPTVNITSPADGTTFLQGSTLTFQGSGTDPEDGRLTGGSLVWTSSLDGDIGTGESFSRNDLSLGFHTITLTGTDSGGGTGFDSVTIRIRVPNQPPTASIVSPTDGATFVEGSSITFQGVAVDSEDGPLTAKSLVWASSIDGNIGTGRSFSRDDLSLGTHTITLTATDSEGASGWDTVMIGIIPPNRPPVVTITSPADGGSYLAETFVIFEGGASDPEDGPLTGASLVWTSSVDGDIGTGQSFMRDDLSLGTHTVTLTGTDSQGLSISELISIKLTDEIPAGEGRIYLLKTDPDGNLEWEKAVGGGVYFLFDACVDRTADGGYVVGSTISPYGRTYVQLLKTDATGLLEWSRAYGGSESNRGGSVQQTGDGGYIVAGDTMSFGAGNGDVYLVKTDPSGVLEWQRTFGGTERDRGWSVKQTSDGGYVVAGGTSSFDPEGHSEAYLVKTDGFGQLEWEKTYAIPEAFSVQQTTDSGYIVTGNPGGFGVSLLKTDLSGTLEWKRELAGYSHSACSVRQTTDGGYIVTGATEWPGFENESDVYLLKTDSAGNPLWEKTFGGAGADWGVSVQQAVDGGYIVTGWVHWDNLGDPDSDLYLLKTDSLGNIIWEKTFGGDHGDWGLSVQQTADGGYVVAGYTSPSGGPH